MIAFLTASLAALALPQDLTHKAAPQSEPIAITGATIHPVAGLDIENGWILFEKGKIQELGSGPFEREGVRTLDASGKHVWPGLISSHSALGLVEISAVRASDDYRETGDFTPEVRASVAVNPDSTLIPVTRSNGILTFASFPSGGLVAGRAGVMRMDGWTSEEMALDDSAGLVIEWPRLRPIRAWWMEASEEDQLEDTRKELRRLEEIFDAAGAYLTARKADPTLPIDLHFEAMREMLPGHAEGRQKPVFVMADDLDEIRAASEFGARRGLKIVIVGGRDASACAELLKAHGTAVIVKGTFRLPKRDDSAYNEPYTLPAELDAAGVRYCIASGEETAHERNLPYSAALAVAHGLSPDAAMRALTIYAADILGVADKIGSLEAGKHATLIVTDGHPLEVTTRTLHAFIDGREIDLSNKQTKLAEKYRAKYQQR